ncbi:hypothetical protein EVAR_75606_1 [Eumeta japonica]|uniref:Uncharacterized protein n=1 Tax=Eumeta variegata TaxID=151549 RepID=A0A4C1U0Q0_EUMVA|nr:hypothetical protein EVAR_75606_1 [Eumeta japonica]
MYKRHLKSVRLSVCTDIVLILQTCSGQPPFLTVHLDERKIFQLLLFCRDSVWELEYHPDERPPLDVETDREEVNNFHSKQAKFSQSRSIRF